MFYIKSLLLYGVVLAFFYCPSMHYEQKYDETSAELAAERGIVAADDLRNNGVQGEVYHYPRMMNIIEQCRAIESEYHVGNVDFGSYKNNNLSDVATLLEDTEKVIVRLQEEKDRFADYVSSLTFSRAALLSNNGDTFSRKKRRLRMRRYTFQVLERCNQKMLNVQRSLKLLKENIERSDAEARARSESRARERSAELS